MLIMYQNFPSNNFRKLNNSRLEATHIKQETVIRSLVSNYKITVSTIIVTDKRKKGFPDSSVGKESAAMQETLIRFLGWEDPLEKGYATHSSILGLPFWLS